MVILWLADSVSRKCIICPIVGLLSGWISTQFSPMLIQHSTCWMKPASSDGYFNSTLEPCIQVFTAFSIYYRPDDSSQGHLSPVAISIIRTPKLYIFDLTVTLPVSMTSGAMYPLVCILSLVDFLLLILLRRPKIRVPCVSTVRKGDERDFGPVTRTIWQFEFGPIMLGRSDYCGQLLRR